MYNLYLTQLKNKVTHVVCLDDFSFSRTFTWWDYLFLVMDDTCLLDYTMIKTIMSVVDHRLVFRFFISVLIAWFCLESDRSCSCDAFNESFLLRTCWNILSGSNSILHLIVSFMGFIHLLLTHNFLFSCLTEIVKSSSINSIIHISIIHLSSMRIVWPWIIWSI